MENPAVYRLRIQRIINEAYNAGWDEEGSADAPAWCADEWELWARHWKIGRADAVEEAWRIY